MKQLIFLNLDFKNCSWLFLLCHRNWNYFTQQLWQSDHREIKCLWRFSEEARKVCLFDRLAF